jgi:transcriptional regulator with XRE-family HTH domain
MQQDTEGLLARFVQYERKRRGWSQRDLAKRLHEAGHMDIHATGITRLERGERAIRVNELKALCEVFDRTVADVFASLETMAAVGGKLVEGQAATATGTAYNATVQTDAVGLTDSSTVELVEAPPTIEEVAETVRLIVGTAHEMISDALIRVDPVKAKASIPTPTVAGRPDQDADGVDQ